MLWILGQMATPYGQTPADISRLVVVFKDERVRRCGCIDRIERRLLTELRGTVRRVIYGTEKNVLYLLLKPDSPIDTAAVGRILREEGVRNYEIRR